MQTLYIQRHGHAEVQSAGQERSLTPAGERGVRAAAEALSSAGLRLATIAHSPLLRTRQTAELMHPCLAPGGEVVACPLLAPGSDADALVAWLAQHLPARTPLLVVAHMPEVALWTELWSAPGSAASLLFAPGSMARLDLPGPLVPGAASLCWLRSVEALAAATASTGA